MASWLALAAEDGPRTGFGHTDGHTRLGSEARNDSDVKSSAAGSLSWNSQFTQYADSIPFGPTLDDLPAGDAAARGPRERFRLGRNGDATQSVGGRSEPGMIGQISLTRFRIPLASRRRTATVTARGINGFRL